MKFYKYRPINIRTLSILRSNKIWFARPNQFNDPFDGYLDLPDVQDEQAAVSHALYHLAPGSPYGAAWYGQSLLESMSREGVSGAHMLGSSTKASESEQILKRRGVLSLAEDFDTLLMWSHYADEHKGLCIGIEIDVDQLPEELRLVKVEYIDEDIPIIDAKSLTSDIDAEINILSTKFIDWSYEKEWRLISTEPLETHQLGKVYNIPGEITDIYFGMKALPDQIELVKSCCPDARHKYMQPMRHRYKITAQNSPLLK